MEVTVPHEYRYQVYKPDLTFLAEWSDVISDFELADEINTGGGALRVKLGRSINQREVTIETLTDDSLAAFTDDADDPFLIETSRPRTVGEGSDVAVNNYVYVDEYFGSIFPLMDDNDQVLTDDDDEPLMLESGSLDGHRVFSGYISKYGVTTSGGREGISVDLLPFSADLSGDVTTVPLGWETLVPRASGATAFSNNVHIIQSFTTKSYEAGYIGWIAINFYFPSPTNVFPVVDLDLWLYTGLDPDSPSRILLATSTVSFPTEGYYRGGRPLSFRMPPEARVQPSSGYHFEYRVRQPVSDGRYPIAVYFARDPYPDGAFWQRNATGGPATLRTNDLNFHYFIIDSVPTEYTFTNREASYIPTFIMFDSPLTRLPGRMAYDYSRPALNSINVPSTLLIPSIEVKNNTYKQAIDSVIQHMPVGYYWRFDHERRFLILRKQSATADHVLHIGEHVAAPEVGISMENMVNTIYFIGGVKADGSKLFKKYEDQSSVSQYGVKAKIISDARYTVESSADTVASYELALHAQPEYTATVTVVAGVYNLASLNVGDMVTFTGAGNFIDDLLLPIVSLRRTKYQVQLQLGSKPQTERNKVEEMRQAVASLAAENTPDTPS